MPLTRGLITQIANYIPGQINPVFLKNRGFDSEKLTLKPRLWLG